MNQNTKKWIAAGLLIALTLMSIYTIIRLLPTLQDYPLPFSIYLTRFLSILPMLLAAIGVIAGVRLLVGIGGGIGTALGVYYLVQDILYLVRYSSLSNEWADLILSLLWLATMVLFMLTGFAKKKASVMGFAAGAAYLMYVVVNIIDCIVKDYSIFDRFSWLFWVHSVLLIAGCVMTGLYLAGLPDKPKARPVPAGAAAYGAPYANPGYARPAYPNAQPPQYGQPAYSNVQQPQYGQPAYPNVQQPQYAQPVYPNVQQPQYGQPVYPNVQQPQYGQPAAPGAQQPQYAQPEQPATPGGTVVMPDAPGSSFNPRI